MKNFALLLTLILVGCAAKTPIPIPPMPNKDWTITATWNYNFTNMIACSASVVNGCVSGFSWGYLSGTTQMPLKTSPLTVCTGSTQPQVCTDTTNSQLPIGSLTFFVSVNYLTSSGAAGTATTNTVQALSIAAASPTNVTFAVQ